MSTKYKSSNEIPDKVIAERLEKLSDAVVARINGNKELFDREFTCSIPAQLDRDADLVLLEAAKRIDELDEIKSQTK